MIMEIYAGIRDSERVETAEFFQALLHIPLDEAIGQQAGAFLQQYQQSHNVTLADAMIAAVSLLRHLKLWTLNKKHYPMMSAEHFLS